MGPGRVVQSADQAVRAPAGSGVQSRREAFARRVSVLLGTTCADHQRRGRVNDLMSGGRRSSFLPTVTVANGMRVTSSLRAHAGHSGAAASLLTSSSKFFEQR